MRLVSSLSLLTAAAATLGATTAFAAPNQTVLGGAACSIDSGIIDRQYGRAYNLSSDAVYFECPLTKDGASPVWAKSWVIDQFYAAGNDQAVHCTLGVVDPVTLAGRFDSRQSAPGSSPTPQPLEHGGLSVATLDTYYYYACQVPGVRNADGQSAVISYRVVERE